MQASPIKLVVGLGNPGEKYNETRHNAGFLFLDELCREFNAELKTDKNCFGKTVKLEFDGGTVRLLAPDTFMNLSGKAVVAAMNFYKINIAEVLVVHDELDLPPGIAKLKFSGGHGGHNGLRDIIAKTGSKDFARLRIGIGHPGHASAVTGFVLKKAPKQDHQLMLDSFIEASRVMPKMFAGEIQLAMNELHTR